MDEEKEKEPVKRKVWKEKNNNEEKEVKLWTILEEIKSSIAKLGQSTSKEEQVTIAIPPTPVAQEEESQPEAKELKKSFLDWLL